MVNYFEFKAFSSRQKASHSATLIVTLNEYRQVRMPESSTPIMIELPGNKPLVVQAWIFPTTFQSPGTKNVPLVTSM
jgi:hypothetical protein